MTGFSLPTGRKLEQPGHDPGYVGTVGPLRRADEARLRLARKRLREIPVEDIEGDGRYLVDKSTGEELEVIVSHVDLADPKTSGAEAFVVRDGLLVPLRPAGWHGPAESQGKGRDQSCVGVRLLAGCSPPAPATARVSDGARQLACDSTFRPAAELQIFPGAAGA